MKLLTLQKFAELTHAGFSVHFTPGHEPRPWRAELTHTAVADGHRSATGATPEEAVTELARERAKALKTAADDISAQATRAAEAAAILQAAVTEEVAGG